MKTKIYLFCLLGILLGLYGCDLEPEVEPSVNVDYLLMKRLGMTSTNLDVYNLSGCATLKPEGRQIVEAGFIYSYYSGLNASSVINESANKKIPCEIKGDQISFNIQTSDTRNISSGVTYCLAYMILSDGTVVASPTYRVSIYDIVGDIKITTGEATDIEYDEAKLNGNLQLTGNATLKEYGFYYGTVPNPEQKISASKGFTYDELDYSIELVKLSPDTKYYYRAYGIDINGKVIKGEERSFTTKIKPGITMNDLSLSRVGMDNMYRDIYHLKGSATLHPEGYEVAEAGFIFSAYPGLNASDVTSNGTANKIACEIENNKITIDDDIIDSYNIYGGATYILAYMILKDGTVIVTNTQKLSSN